MVISFLSPKDYKFTGKLLDKYTGLTVNFSSKSAKFMELLNRRNRLYSLEKIWLDLRGNNGNLLRPR